MIYPIGRQNFENLRNEGFVYVDKTALIYKLVKEGSIYFLSRPRRFGKSLLLSTLEAYFTGKKELFTGLAIEQLEKDWHKYPVLHLDLNAKKFDKVEDLYDILNAQLHYYEELYGNKAVDTSIEGRFRAVIRAAKEKTGHNVAVLIDEYDKPILQAIGNEPLQEEFRNMLKAFYGVLKSADADLKFALLTGVTKFAKVSVFSDLNNLKDISMSPHFHNICGITDEELAPNGTGDGLSQAYNYRICLTDSLENMIPIEKPENYDPAHYELLLRLMEAQPDKRELTDYFIWSRMPGRKTDVNNKGGFSTDMIGANHEYPEASYEERAAIVQAHKDYTLGLLYFVGHDERIPEEIRTEMLRWGLPKDEYVETGHWSPQLYIRECRRMIGEYVATQKDCEQKTTVEDWVAMAAYTMDSHNCRRIVVVKDGVPMVKNEGNVEVKVGGPFPVSYRSVTPKREECTNLLVPIALSASHIAYGSIRMEPVFMVLGQACGIAASLAEDMIQTVSAEKIRNIMHTDPYMDGSQADIIIDDGDSCISVSDGWTRTKGRRGYGPTYYELSGDCTEKFVEYRLPADLDGEWDIYCFQQLKDRTNPLAHYSIRMAGHEYRRTFDRSQLQLVGQVSGEWFHLGTYDFEKGDEGIVTMTSDPSEYPLRADALLLVKR